MQRSFVNELISQSSAGFQRLEIALPRFAFLSPDELREAAHENLNIARCRLGWDVTDYGKGRYNELGLTLFTLRNVPGGSRFGGYCEKLMFCQKDQACQLHRHGSKSGDIINRGGGHLILSVFNSGDDGRIDQLSKVTIAIDGRHATLNAGAECRLLPGESVTLPKGIWHRFVALNADVIIGEVSTYNDDLNDNYFTEDVDRFLSIDEDVLPAHLLVSDYVRWL